MNADTERWLPVVGFEGLYEVSDLGRVRSLDREIVQVHAKKSYRYPGRLLKLTVGKNGYPNVSLSYGHGDKRLRTVHTLVAQAFLGPRPDATAHVRHLNDVKTDNRLANLCWGSPSENMYDRCRNGLHHKANMTHCKQGHAYTPENTLTRKSGRLCRECKRESSRKTEAKRPSRAGWRNRRRAATNA